MTESSGLSAPEAFVLMSLPKFDARKALKLGFMGLLAQGLLRLEREDRRGMIRTRHIAHLSVAANLPERLSPVAASLTGVVRAAAPAGLMTDVVKQSMRQYGKALSGFVERCIAPALIARGLAERRQTRLLGLIPATRVFRTSAGESEKIRLEGLMREARSIPRYLDREPAQAAALVAALGGAFLLVEELRPHYQAIAMAMRPLGGDTAYSSGDFDFGSIDFSAFDAGAFDSFDAGFSDAGGDGGDGGSSGC